MLTTLIALFIAASIVGDLIGRRWPALRHWPRPVPAQRT